MAKMHPPTQRKNYGPAFKYWAQFETLSLGDIALMMKGLDPSLEDETPEWADTDTSTEILKLESAVRVGTLVGYPEGNSGPTVTTQVSVESLIDWLSDEGPLNIANGLRAARDARAHGNSRGAAEAGNPSSSTAVVAGCTAQSNPPPVRTSDIAFSFDGLKWPVTGWKKALGDKPVWLLNCCVEAGSRGVKEARWDPVLIGAALVRREGAKQNAVRARFQSRGPLKPWLEEWKTYEADNLDSP